MAKDKNKMNQQEKKNKDRPSLGWGLAESAAQHLGGRQAQLDARIEGSMPKKSSSKKKDK